LNEVLEQVNNVPLTLVEIYRVLKPGGFFVLISPNRFFPFEGHGMKIRGKKLNFPIPFLPWFPRKWTWRFMRARNYWPKGLQELVRNAGFTNISTTFMFPLFEVYRWMPEPGIYLYKRLLPTIERNIIFRNFGVSTFVLSERPKSSNKYYADLCEGKRN
jgi:SAM-dependent methyltransferase